MTDTMTVILDRRELVVSLDGKALRIDRPGGQLQRIPLGMIRQVIAYGSPQVGCNVWRALGERGIPAVLLPARGSGEAAYIGPGLSTAIMIRIAQFNAWSDIKRRREIAAFLVKKKISGQLGLLESLDIEAGAGTVFCQATGALCKETKKSISRNLAGIPALNSIDAMRGLEGASAKTWFSFMTQSLDRKWGFSGRNRRPPKDPVNALLSLSYTLLAGEVKRRIQLRGLDPCLGFLHSPYPGRDSLVLDIMEPLRPGVDAFVLGLLDGMMSPGDFKNSAKEGCRIVKKTRGLFFMSWEEWKNSWPVWAGTSQEPDIRSLDSAIRELLQEWTGHLGPFEDENLLEEEDGK